MQDAVREKLLTYLGGAFALVAGLAWNDAVKALIEVLFPLSTDGLVAKFSYATLVTVFVVIITLVLHRVLNKRIEEK